ncbi:hypothetical protein ABPG74_015474 [Tetrahymena malaccensis]
MKDSNKQFKQSQHSSDRRLLTPGSDYTKLISQESNTNSLNQQNDFKNQERREICEANSYFSESFEMQFEGYEIKDLLQKFYNLQKNNISKNIIKAFFNYLLNTKQNDLLTDFVLKGTSPNQALKMTKYYFKSYNFNNKSLHKLVIHPKFGKAFEYYLTFEAEIWLAESKVQQKETHLIYIDFLKLICSNSEYASYLVTYKKNKKSRYDNKI